MFELSCSSWKLKKYFLKKQWNPSQNVSIVSIDYMIEAKYSIRSKYRLAVKHLTCSPDYFALFRNVDAIENDIQSSFYQMKSSVSPSIFESSFTL